MGIRTGFCSVKGKNLDEIPVPIKKMDHGLDDMDMDMDMDIEDIIKEPREKSQNEGEKEKEGTVFLVLPILLGRYHVENLALLLHKTP